VLWAASYSVWADIDLLHAAAVDNPIRLQGQYADPETGLSYNRHRYFCPHAGQFISQDPIQLQGGDHLYAFAADTLGWIDPLGLKCKGAKRGPKPKGTGPHNLTIARRIEELKKSLGPDWTHTGGGSLKEDVIRTPLGKKSARRPDITFTNPKTGEKYYENVGKKDALGNPIKREREAIADISTAKGVPVVFTPYN
jgi:RHS repeat-associated protein